MKSKLLAIFSNTKEISERSTKNDDQFQWVDNQVLKSKRNVDRAYKNAKLAESDPDKNSKQLWLDYTDKNVN